MFKDLKKNDTMRSEKKGIKLFLELEKAIYEIKISLDWLNWLGTEKERKKIREFDGTAIKLPNLKHRDDPSLKKLKDSLI